VCALWYIDGMHDTLNERSHKIPIIFSQFTGYKKPESHRHRKQAIQERSSFFMLIKSIFVQTHMAFTEERCGAIITITYLLY